MCKKKSLNVHAASKSISSHKNIVVTTIAFLFEDADLVAPNRQSERQRDALHMPVHAETTTLSHYNTYNDTKQQKKSTTYTAKLDHRDPD